MKINPNRLWILAVLLGWSFDFLFWERDAGLNFALFSTLGLLGGFGLLASSGHRPAPRALWLLIPFAFFAALAFLRQEPLTLFLGYALSLFCLGVLANTYLGGRWLDYGMTEYFSRFFWLIGSMFALPRRFIQETKKEQAASGAKPFPIAAILRGLLIALPIVALFASLLASADAVFDQKLAGYFDDFDLTEQILRGLIILAVAYLLAGVVLHALAQGREERLLEEGKPRWKQVLGFTEASIVLGSVAALFLFFVVIQFQYFFGGQTNIGVEGFTYSSYARRGFNELIMVAFFNLVMILGLGVFTRRETETQRRAYSALSVVIVAEVTVILVSAYQRLMLAIDWHGFSRLRLYPSVFLIWVGILLVAVVVLEILRRERRFALAFVLASFGFAVSLAFLNVDASIVTHNLERVKHGKNLNVAHLASLSADAVPALVEKFLDPSLPPELHEGVGAILVCYLNSSSIRPIEDWRSFNLSLWRANRALDEVKPALTEYHYNQNRYPPPVRTPGKFTYFCVDQSGSDIAE
ncbi:MAG: DUF4173 domain-containing protein [Chloroflexota bacterium]